MGKMNSKKSSEIKTEEAKNFFKANFLKKIDQKVYFLQMLIWNHISQKIENLSYKNKKYKAL